MSAMASDTAKSVRGQGKTSARARLTSLDAYGGLVRLLMMADALNLRQVAQNRPDTGLWRFLARHQSQVTGIRVVLISPKLGMAQRPSGG